jgi:spermidine/putrescine transport system substrate-binding protein
MTNRTRVLLAALATMVATLVLAACGGDGGLEEDSGNENVPTAEGGPVQGDLTISNWPLYIDPGPKGTVAEFERKTGVSTEYIEDVNDNGTFFGKLQPQLAQGDSGGRSIFVLTDWMAKKMYDLGYLQEIDHNDLPTVFENLSPALESPSFDPERKFSVPWQSGMTGLVVRTDLAGDVKSINDLFDPKYKGKVTMLTELRDTVPLVMKADGVDPNEADTQDWLDAIDKIQEAVDSGQIRRFTGNDYAQDLASGNVVAAIGWSGDAVQLQADNQNIEWRMPSEGCILWSDNMVIPVGAPNTAAALGFMDFVYEPQVQADITAYVNYVSPVAGVKEILLKRDPKLANNQLIFPSEEFTADCSTQPTLSAEEEETVNEAFQGVITG